MVTRGNKLLLLFILGFCILVGLLYPKKKNCVNPVKNNTRQYSGLSSHSNMQDVACPLQNGSTLVQLKRYLNKGLNGPLRPLTDKVIEDRLIKIREKLPKKVDLSQYKHNVTIIGVEKDPLKAGSSVHLMIQETFQGKPTTGGSTFRGDAHGARSIDVCSVSDCGNGEYNVNCSAYEKKVTVHLRWMYVNYEAFSGHKNISVINKTVHMSNINISDRSPPISNSTSNIPDCTTEFIKQLTPNEITNGFYVKQKETYRWMVKSCLFPSLTKEFAVNCVNTLGSLNMTGDSHLHRTYLHFMSVLGQNLSDPIVSPYRLYHQWSRFSNDMLQYLNNTYTAIHDRKTTDKPVVVVLETSQFDLQYGEGIRKLAPMLKVIAKSIYEFKKLHGYKFPANVRFIWMASPGMENVIPVGDARQATNIYIMEMVNLAAREEMEALGVEYFDLHKLLLPRADTRADPWHYLTLVGHNKMGGAGIQPAELLFYSICNKYGK